MLLFHLVHFSLAKFYALCLCITKRKVKFGEYLVFFCIAFFCWAIVSTLHTRCSVCSHHRNSLVPIVHLFTSTQKPINKIVSWMFRALEENSSTWNYLCCFVSFFGRFSLIRTPKMWFERFCFFVGHYEWWCEQLARWHKNKNQIRLLLIDCFKVFVWRNLF